jgi:hypothetical protein
VPPERIVMKRIAEQQGPERFELMQNFPNPFNPMTTIQFTLSAPSIVTLKVYNVLGQVVSTVYNGEQMDEGLQEFTFNGTNLASGVYFYSLTVTTPDRNGVAQRYRDVKKMMLVK